MQTIPIVVPQYSEQVQPLNPMDAVSKALGIVNAAQSAQAGGIALREKQQEMKDDQDLRSAAQQAQGDPDKIYDLLSTSNPRAAALWGKQLADRRKAETDNTKDQLANAQSRIDLIGQISQGIKDENSFQRGKQQLTSALGPQAAAILGDAYDQSRIQQITDSSLKHKDWLDAQDKAINQAQKAQELVTNKGKEDREARTAWEQSLAHAFMGVGSQDDFDNVRKTYGNLGAPKDLLALYGDIWSPDLQKKAAAVLGPEAMKAQDEMGTRPADAAAAKKQISAIFGGEKDPRYQNYAAQLDALGGNPIPKVLDDLVKEARKEAGQTRTAVATAKATEPIKIETGQATQAGPQLAKSKQFNQGELNKIATPIDQLVSRVGRLQETLNQPGTVQEALIAPELLSIMSGGAGSGLRMNESELNRINNARGFWEGLKVAVSKFNPNDQSTLVLSPEQKTAIRKLATAVAQKAQQKQRAISVASKAIANAEDSNDPWQAMVDLRDKLNAVDAGPQTATPKVNPFR